TAADAAYVHFRPRGLPVPHCSRNRARPRLTSGRQPLSGSTVVSRSSTHRLTCTSLFCSISLDVLLSKGFLCAAAESPNGRRIQVQSRGHFLVAEAVAAQD